MADEIVNPAPPEGPPTDDVAFTAPVSENDRAAGEPNADALAALALPVGDPRRPQALEAALRSVVGA